MKDLTLVIEGVPVTLPEAEWSRIVAVYFGNSKVTMRDAYDIRRAYHSGRASMGELATRYGICRRTVLRIIKGYSHSYVPHPASARSYKHLHDPELAVFIEEV